MGIRIFEREKNCLAKKNKKFIYKKIKIIATFFKFWKDNTTLNLLTDISRSTLFSI